MIRTPLSMRDWGTICPVKEQRRCFQTRFSFEPTINPMQFRCSSCQWSAILAPINAYSFYVLMVNSCYIFCASFPQIVPNQICKISIHNATASHKPSEWDQYLRNNTPSKPNSPEQKKVWTVCINSENQSWEKADHHDKASIAIFNFPIITKVVESI